MTGEQLTTFITGLNGEATIDPDLLNVLVDNAKAIIEEERPWMVLRKTSTAKSVTTASTWQTAIDLSTITDFSRFYDKDGGVIIQLFDGSSRIHEYYLKPFEDRLNWKDVSDTCVYNENSKTLYLNGTVPFNGTLYIPYVSSSTAIDLTEDTDPVWSVFPSRFTPLLGYYAIGVYKGAVDYDTINKQMLPTNAAVLGALKNAMERWDNEKQLSALASNNPSGGGGWRSGAIDRDA